MNSEIEKLREKIDQIEDKLIALLNERASLVLEIGKIKKHNDFPVKDSSREKAILDRIVKKNTGIISNEFLQDLFKKIIEESVRIEENTERNI